MAGNSYGKVWKLDTEGVISIWPVYIKKLVLYPNAADDVAILTYWGPEAVTSTARATQETKTVTVTSTTTITSTGNFEAAEVVVNDIIEIDVSSTGNNLGSWQVGTRSSDNAIIVDIGTSGFGQDGGAMTNEASKVYNWKTWVPDEIAKLSCMDANEPYQLPLDGINHRGQLFPNLALHSLSTSAVVWVYYG